MPIVGPVTGAATTAQVIKCGFIVGQQWWHATVFATSYSELTSFNVPDLTTIHQYPAECTDRWMMLAPDLAPDAGCNTSDSTSGNATVFSVDPARSIVSDPLYRSCQKYSTAVYSPGVCPGGYSMAEITAIISSIPSGNKTFWSASCCRSGMTIGPEWPSACVSHVATPVRAWARITTSPAFSGATPTPVYEYTPYATQLAATSSIVTISSGLAVADPVIVGWQVDDLRLFPSDYATSVARKIGITLPSTTTTSSSSLPSKSTNSRTLSTAAKAGVGVGVALGLAIIAIVIAILVIRKRQKRKIAIQDPGIPEMGDRDHGCTEGKSFIGGKWRNEAHAEGAQNELDSNLVHEALVPPAELDSTEVQAEMGIGMAVDNAEHTFSQRNRETPADGLAT